jgi:hypothetical protein
VLLLHLAEAFEQEEEKNRVGSREYAWQTRDITYGAPRI